MPVHSGEHEESTTAEVQADALDPLIGTVVDGRFRIVDIIGKGAMGKVYRAVQLPLNRAVALKVLDSRYGAGRDESFKQRFLVEAALTSKLNHPNTVRVLDYGTRDGLFFLAMEYLDGDTLEKLLAKGPLPWHRVLNIGVQMARALREAHELGVVHRDLKPGNVVLLHADDDTDFVKVLDFGLVKSFVDGQELEGRAITQQGMLMGSPPYMAPEQGEKNRADPRSDIYSLGTMLFEMLTGAPPFVGGGALEVILKHVHQPVPALVTPSNFEAVPAPLQAIVNKCLAKSPMDRFQSMDELLLAMLDVGPARVPQEPLHTTATAVTDPTAIPDDVVLQAPPRSPSGWLVGGFFAAVVAGLFITWAVMRPAAPTAVSFHVESSPAGADVVVDGKKLGVTPIDLEQPLGAGERGSMELRMEKAGFAPAVVRLTAGGGKLEVVQTLAPLSAPSPVPPAGAKTDAVPAPALAPPATAKVDPAPAPTATPPAAAKVEPSPAPPTKPAPALATGAKAAPSGASPTVKTEPTPSPRPAPAVAKVVPAPVVEPAKKQPKISAAAKLEAKKKAPVSPTPVTGTVKPASRLDEEEEPGPAKNELKRPSAQP